MLSTGVLDYRQETPLGPVLDGLGVPVRRPRAALDSGGEVEVFDLVLGGVRVTLLATASSRIERSSDRAESATFLDLAEQRTRALASVRRWDPDRLAGEYERFFGRFAGGSGSG